MYNSVLCYYLADLTDQQKIQKAEREKEKGNEAFRSNDFAEALLYYNRSLSLIPTIACRNNRAQTCTCYLCPKLLVKDTQL